MPGPCVICGSDRAFYPSAVGVETLCWDDRLSDPTPRHVLTAAQNALTSTEGLRRRLAATRREDR